MFAQRVSTGVSQSPSTDRAITTSNQQGNSSMKRKITKFKNNQLKGVIMICSTLNGMMAIKHPKTGVLVREDGMVFNSVRGNPKKNGLNTLGNTEKRRNKRS